MHLFPLNSKHRTIQHVVVKLKRHAVWIDHLRFPAYSIPEGIVVITLWTSCDRRLDGWHHTGRVADVEHKIRRKLSRTGDHLFVVFRPCIRTPKPIGEHFIGHDLDRSGSNYKLPYLCKMCCFPQQPEAGMGRMKRLRIRLAKRRKLRCGGSGRDDSVGVRSGVAVSGGRELEWHASAGVTTSKFTRRGNNNQDQPCKED